MTIEIGIILAFVAMLCWGVGDFTIQKSARKFGDWETLFVITAFGTIILLPFVWKSIPQLVTSAGNHLAILIGAGLVLTTAAILHFEGFKKGKLSVLEPLLSFELIAASIMAFFILGDDIGWLQIVTIVILVVGLMLVSFREKVISRKMFLEKGVLIFFCGAILMGFADFLLAWGSRVTDPILANFVLNVVMVFVSGIFVIAQDRVGHLIGDIKKSPALLLVMSITDNIAWIAYAVAMSIIPVAVATGVSESSIIIAVLLGLFINKEKLQAHQKVGLIIALISVVVLASSL